MARGLAPLSDASRGVGAEDALSPIEDLRVFGPLRALRHQRHTERREITPEDIDAVIPLMAQGLLELLRPRLDVDLSKVGEGKVE